MKEEIENYKNEKQIQTNSVKQNNTKLWKSITENRNRIQNDLNQTKDEMKSLQKDLSELIQKHQQLERKYSSNLQTTVHQKKQTSNN